jgi:hypothetical protein
MLGAPNGRIMRNVIVDDCRLKACNPHSEEVRIPWQKYANGRHLVSSGHAASFKFL